MSILYSLISRAPDIVLCEYSDLTGNFMQISRVILQKVVKPDTKYSINYDRFKVHYINENKITYLCLSDGISDTLAFAFLDEIRRKLLQNFTFEDLANLSSFRLPRFIEILKQYMLYYNTHPSTTKMGEVINELNIASDAMQTCIENLIERDFKMSIIATKSDNLKGRTLNVKAMAKAIRQQQQGRRNRIYLMVSIVLVVFIVLLYYVF